MKIMLNAKLKTLSALLLVFLLPALVLAQKTFDAKNSDQTPPSDARNEQPDMKFDGAVVLRVTFLASGSVGDVEIVSGLSDELNRQAIAAARKIKFQPEKKDGSPASVTKKVEYTFFTYYKENDPDLRTNAEITKNPAPASPKAKEVGNAVGKIRLKLLLRADGKVEIDEIKSDLPKEFGERARQAASKIKFKPAVAKDGRKVSQIKEIEYEFKSEND